MWRLKAVIQSGVLLISVQHEFRLFLDDGKLEVRLSKPRTVTDASWPGWERGLPIRIWEYDVIADFNEASDGTPDAWHWLESLVARLSFLGSAPVWVKSYGSLSNAPEAPEPGVSYTSISYSQEVAWEETPKLTLSEAQWTSAAKLLLAPAFGQGRTERIERCMRWIQHSYLAQTPVDEFVCLMTAFEAISHLLKPSGKTYWRCGKCGEETKECPKCGASTEHESSGYIGMRDFVVNGLSWNDQQWRDIWKYRNSIFHGGEELSKDLQADIARLVPKLEEAVVNALRFLLKLSEGMPPMMLRSRNPLFAASLTTNWTSPDRPGADNGPE